MRPPVNRSMVRAVGDASDDGIPVEVRFALHQRPTVGHPAKLDIEFVPTGAVDKVVASYHAQAGLKFAHGTQPTQADHPKPGVPIDHDLTLVAQRDGIFCVTATVLVNSASGSVARTFTIPIIAGDGLH